MGDIATNFWRPLELYLYKLFCIASFTRWKYLTVPCSDSDGHLLAPFSVGYVKGWKRSVCLLVVLAAVKRLDLAESISERRAFQKSKVRYTSMHLTYSNLTYLSLSLSLSLPLPG